MPADSFYDLTEREPTCLEDLSPREKVEYFVKGMQDNAIDLVHFRTALETSAAVAHYESELWQIKNALELVLSSIRCERETKRDVRAVKSPTIILVQ